MTTTVDDNASTLRSSPTLDPAVEAGQRDGKAPTVVPIGIGLDGEAVTPSLLEKNQVEELRLEEKQEEEKGNVIWVEFEGNGERKRETKLGAFYALVTYAFHFFARP